jgi:hypothetical protein
MAPFGDSAFAKASADFSVGGSLQLPTLRAGQENTGARSRVDEAASSKPVFRVSVATVRFLRR